MEKIENQMYFYLRILTVMGYFPFEITDEGLKPSTILKWFGSVPMGTALVIVTVLAGLELPKLEIREAVLRSIHTLLGIALLGAAIITPILKSKLYCNVFQQINRVDECFRYLGIRMDVKKNKYPPLLMLFTHICVLGVVSATDFVIPHSHFSAQLPAYAWVFHRYILLIMAFVIINCMVLAHLIVTRFDAINKELENIDQSELACDVLDLDTISANRLAIDLYRTKRAIKISPMHRKILNAKDDAANIRVLQKCHYELYGISSSLSDLFTFSVLLTVLIIGLEILFSCYIVLKRLLRVANFIELLMWIKYIIYDLFRTICILRAFTSIKKSGNRTSYLVQGLILKAEDPNVQNELMKFSHQLHHQKIDFSNFGFFTLDMSLLVSMAGAITTFLVILLQNSGSEKTSPGVMSTN